MQGACSVAAGDLVGRYRIDEALSASDAFQVFRAWDVARERQAILEIAWPGVGGADAAGARLVRESELLARAVDLADDSHLIAIYEVGTIEVQLGRPRVSAPWPGSAGAPCGTCWTAKDRSRRPARRRSWRRLPRASMRRMGLGSSTRR